MDRSIFLPDDLANGSYCMFGGSYRWALHVDGTLEIEGRGCVDREERYVVNSGDGWDSHYSTEMDKWPWEGLRDYVRRVVLHEGITKLGYGAFEKCSNLAEVCLPESLTEIDTSAFRNTALKSIRLPAGLKKVSCSAFEGTPMMKEEDFYLDGWLIRHWEKEKKTYTVRPGTVKIADSALEFGKIEELHIPGSVQLIGENEIRTLRRVYLGAGCTADAEKAFFKCKPADYRITVEQALIIREQE